MDLAPGLMVTSNVRLARPLGRGAMGWVWVADHLTLQTEVAVKFISAELAVHDEELLTRFVQEASLAAQIKSPHVVQVFDQGRMPDGSPYIVMELLEGESLQDWLDRRGRLTLHEADKVITHVARALRKAHELGIVHRDIKPDNIFVQQTEDGIFCKVLDFGIAKQTQLPKTGLTNAGVMVGTPEYMSPEQVLSAKDVDFRADLWALAVTAYHMLTGELPFWAEALGTLCVKLLDGKFKPASELRRELPAGMDAWFTKALAHSPDDRYDSAREMALAFTGLVQGHGILDEQTLSNSYNLPPGAGPGPIQNLAPTAPLPDASAIQPTAPLPGSIAGQPSSGASGTLTGSSSSKHVPPRSSKGMYAGGALAIAALVGTMVFLLQSPGDQPAPAADTPAATADDKPGDEPQATADEGAEEAAGDGESDPADKDDKTDTSPEPSASASATAVAPPPHIVTPRPTPASGKKKYDHGF